jgi:hypothetical protein
VADGDVPAHLTIDMTDADLQRLRAMAIKDGLSFSRWLQIRLGLGPDGWECAYECGSCGWLKMSDHGLSRLELDVLRCIGGRDWAAGESEIRSATWPDWPEGKNWPEGSRRSVLEQLEWRGLVEHGELTERDPQWALTPTGAVVLEKYEEMVASGELK